MINKKTYLLFFFIIIIFSLLFEYTDIVFNLPQSNASWRQADCASFALNYYQNGMNFFEPRVHNVLTNEGHAVGECPLIYYFVAILYNIFGPHEVIYKIVTLIIFFLGLCALLRLTYRLTSNIIISFIVPLIVFSIPMIMMYAVSFLPDIASFSFLLIAWDYFYKYKMYSKVKNFWLSMLFFALATLLKATAGFSFIALGVMYSLELLNWNNSDKLFRHKIHNVLGFIIVLVVVLGWYSWAVAYNERYGVSFLGTKSWPGWPIWEISNENFIGTITSFFFYSGSMFNLIMVGVFFLTIIFIFHNDKYLDGFLKSIIILLLIATISFIAYFFGGMKDQAYYYVNLSFLPLLTFIASIIIIKNKYKEIFSSKIFISLLLVLLLYNVYEAKTSLKTYFHGGKMHEKLNNNLYDPELRNFIKNLGINTHDKIISIPDITPNVSLYLINRPGWTNYYGIEYTPLKIIQTIKSGAKYLIVSDTSVFFLPGIKQFMNDYLGHFNNIYVYKLPALQKISLVTSDKNYVSADVENEGEFFANRAFAQNWETFVMFNLGDSKIGLLADNNKYCSALLDKGDILVANKDELKEWETFEIIDLGQSKIALRAFNGKYVCADRNKQNRLIARSEQIGEWEIFRIERK